MMGEFFPEEILMAWGADGTGDLVVVLKEADLERLLGPAVRDSGALTWQMAPDGLGIDFMFLDVTVENGCVTASSVGHGLAASPRVSEGCRRRRHGDTHRGVGLSRA